MTLVLASALSLAASGVALAGSGGGCAYGHHGKAAKQGESYGEGKAAARISPLPAVSAPATTAAPKADKAT